MKNKNFLKKLTAGILGFVMTLGVGAAGYAASAGETRAATGSLTVDASGMDYGTSYVDKTAVAIGTEGFKFSSTNIMKGSSGAVSSGLQIKKSGGAIWNSDCPDGYTITSIVFGTNTGGVLTVYKGSTAKPTSTSVTASGSTYTINDSFFTIKNGSSNAAYLQNFTVNYSSGSAPTTNYTVSFNANGGGSSMSNQTTDGSSYVTPSCGFSVPSGKEFDKWALESAGGTQYAVGETISNISSNITLYAVWKNAGGGGGDGQTITVLKTDTTISGTGYNSGAERTWTKDDVDFGAKAVSEYADDKSMFQFQKSNGVFYNTSALPSTIKSFTVNQDSNCSWTFYGGSTSRLVNSTSGNYSVSGTQVTKPTTSKSMKYVMPEDSNYTFFGIRLGSDGATHVSSFVIELRPAAPVHTVTISNFPSSNFYAGESVTLSASCDQTDCEGITWSSSDPTIASISSSGKVIGLKGGTTTITASCPEGGSDSKTLTVVGNGLTLSPSAITDAQKGGTGSITASLSASVTGVSYSWTSNQPGVVSVTGNTATASLSYVSGGTATITCTATVNGVDFTNTCDVTVVTKDPTASFDNPTTEGYTGIQYDFTAVSANIDNGTWSWKVNGQDFTFDDDVDGDGYSIRYATFSEAGSYTITATCTDENDATSTATATTTIVITASSSVLTIDTNSIELQKGSKISITPTLVVTGSYADKTTITVTKEGGVTLNKSATTSGSAVEVTAGSTGGVAKVIFSANGQNVECAISIPKTTVDVITGKTLGLSSTSYADFSGQTFVSEAVYAGKAALEKTETDVLKLNTDSDYGVYTSTSGGVFSKLEVDWGSSTIADRQFAIYGMHTAPTGVKDENKVLLGKIDHNTNPVQTVFEATDAFQYIILKAEKGAIYLNSLSITWIEPTPVESVTAGQKSISVSKGDSSQLSWTVLPTDASNKAVEISMDPVLTGVTISDAGLVSVDSTATVGATSIITIASKENSSIKDTVSFTVLPTYLDNSKALLRTGFTKFTTEQTFASVRGSSNYLEAQYIDGTKKNSKGDNESSMWANTKCYVNNGTSEEPNWVEYNMSSAITNADNGKSFKFIYTEVINNVTYTQESNVFSISVDNVTIKSAITLYYSNSESYAHSHDFTADDEYSATGAVTWSVVDAYSRASITQSGVLTIVDAPTNVGASMQFRVKAVCGACTRYCDVTLRCEPATSVTVDWPDTIGHNASGTFTATVETKYARQAVCWTSSDEALTITGQSSNKLKASWTTAELESDKNVTVTAFVDENGDDTYTEGEAIATKTITIQAAEIPVTEVNITDEDIEIWQDDDDAVNKAQFTLHATVTEGASVQKAKWSIVEGSDNVVVSSGSIYEGLSKSWKFTGNAGTATIRATSMNKENEQVYDEITVTVKQSVLSNISVNASASTVKKDFEIGDTVTAADCEGLVVTATYASGNPGTVNLSDCSLSCDTSKIGKSAVTVSYSLNGVTKTDSYEVNIHAPSDYNIVTKETSYTPGSTVLSDPTLIEYASNSTSGVTDLTWGSNLGNNKTYKALFRNDSYIGKKNAFPSGSDIGQIILTMDNAVASDRQATFTFDLYAEIGEEDSEYHTQFVYDSSKLASVSTTMTIDIPSGSNIDGWCLYCSKNMSSGGNCQFSNLKVSYKTWETTEPVTTVTYKNNQFTDSVYAFIDSLYDGQSGWKIDLSDWDSIVNTDEYKALDSSDKLLLKNGVPCDDQVPPTKVSTDMFTNFINAYDEIVKQYGPNFNVLERSVTYNNYTVEIDDTEIGVLQAGSEYTLPTPIVAEGNKAVYYTADNQIFEAGETINVYEDLALTKVEITDVEKVSVSYEANYKYTTDDNGAFSEVTQTSLRMYISLDADTYNFYVEHGYDFSIVIYNVAKGKSSTINSSSMSIKYDEEKDVYVFNVAFNIPAEQYSTYLDISLIASNGSVSDETIKVTVNYISAAESLYQAYLNGSVSLNSKQVAALKAILNIVD